MTGSSVLPIRTNHMDHKPETCKLTILALLIKKKGKRNAKSDLGALVFGRHRDLKEFHGGFLNDFCKLRIIMVLDNIIIKK